MELPTKATAKAYADGDVTITDEKKAAVLKWLQSDVAGKQAAANMNDASEHGKFYYTFIIPTINEQITTGSGTTTVVIQDINEVAKVLDAIFSGSPYYYEHYSRTASTYTIYWDY